MQMFVLDDIPDNAARALADCHTRVIGREVTMCLSAWYAKNMGHKDELPYKEFNHPIEEQFNDPRTRLWAMHYATAIFTDFKNRFGKVHASEEKLDQLRRYCVMYDMAVHKIGLHQM